MDEIARRQKDRFRFLHHVYKKTGGSQTQACSSQEIGTELGLDPHEIPRIVDYLAGEGLVKKAGFNRHDIAIFITHPGIAEVEAASTSPNNPTEHFPINIINVMEMHHSQIQQFVGDGAQSMLKYSVEGLPDIIEEIRQALDDVKIDPSDRKEAESDLETLLAQAESPRPKRTIVHESLVSIRRILESATGGAVAAGVIQKIMEYLSSSGLSASV